MCVYSKKNKRKITAGVVAASVFNFKWNLDYIIVMWLGMMGGDYDVSEETNENADSVEQRVSNKKNEREKSE